MDQTHLLIVAGLLMVASGCAAASGAPAEAGTQQDNSEKHSSGRHAHKCTRQSMALARQVIGNELEAINGYSAVWFSSLDRSELVEGQKQSLGSMVRSGLSGQMLADDDGQPALEIEASCLKPGAEGQIELRLMRDHADRCYLHKEKGQFTYVLGLMVGPLEHHLDVVQRLPRELRLSQPIEWSYGQLRLLVPALRYEVSLRQAAARKLAGSDCPLVLADVTYLSANKPQVTLMASGLAASNRTGKQLERIFDDYTRPAVSSRLRQVLDFYLNSKTLPLSG